MIQFGLDTFGDVTVDESGAPLSDAQTLRNLVEQAVLADELGIRIVDGGYVAPLVDEVPPAGLADETDHATAGATQSHLLEVHVGTIGEIGQVHGLSMVREEASLATGKETGTVSA